MPDSQVPPIWGPAYDERDLDALLSGETGSVPVALKPVQSTLAALRGAATRRELADEAVARAAFRAFVPVSPTTGPLPWAAEAEPAAVTSHTLVLPPAGRRQQPAARHRHRRRTAGSARRPGIAVTGAAAAALIVVATVVTGALTGSIGELTSFGRQPASASAPARGTGQSPASEGVQVTGAASERPRIPKPLTRVRHPPPAPASDAGSQLALPRVLRVRRAPRAGRRGGLDRTQRAAEHAGGRSESVQDLRVLSSLPRQPARRQGRVGPGRRLGRWPRAPGRAKPGSAEPRRREPGKPAKHRDERSPGQGADPGAASAPASASP